MIKLLIKARNWKQLEEKLQKEYLGVVRLNAKSEFIEKSKR